MEIIKLQNIMERFLTYKYSASAYTVKTASAEAFFWKSILKSGQ